MNKQDIKNAIGKQLYKIFREHKVILAGGSIRSIYQKKYNYKAEYEKEDELKDLDIYFKEEEKISELLKKLLSLGYKKVYSSDNAYTLEKKNEIQIQLIILEKCRGTSEQIIQEFDFSICSGAYDFETETFAFDKYFIEDNKERKLRYNTKNSYPICSLIRVNKYTKKKGYTISNIEMLKIALSISNLNIKTYYELKEQLRGIDTSIFEPLTKSMLGNGEDDNSEDFDEENKEIDLNKFLDQMDRYLEHALAKELEDMN